MVQNYGNFGELVDFAFWWSCIGKCLCLQPVQQACLYLPGTYLCGRGWGQKEGQVRWSGRPGSDFTVRSFRVNKEDLCGRWNIYLSVLFVLVK